MNRLGIFVFGCVVAIVFLIVFGAAHRMGSYLGMGASIAAAVVFGYWHRRRWRAAGQRNPIAQSEQQ